MDMEKLAAAKLWLISPSPNATDPQGPRDLPYLAHALYAQIPIASDAVPRMTCDEWWRTYVNSAWLDSAAIPEVGAELAHLTWHLLADHTTRARDQDVDQTTATAWHTAADITVSHTLAPDHLETLGLTQAAQQAPRPGLSAEEYFALLSGLPAKDPSTDEPSDELNSGCGSGADGIRRHHEHGPDSDHGAVSTFDATEIRRRVAIEYRDHPRHRGTTPGDSLRWIERTLQPTIPWEPLLAGAVRRAIGWAAGRGDYTYTRPSRRASTTPGIVLPGQHRPIPRISIIIDTSASIDDQLLARALGEVDSTLAALGTPAGNLTLYSVDAAAHTAQKIRHIKDAKLIGAGGTDLRVGLRAIEKERPRPEIVIILTDGDTPWPTTPPTGAAIIIALLGRSRSQLPPTPNWASRVECILDNRT